MKKIAALKHSNRLYVILAITLLILLPVQPALAFDPAIAMERVFTISKYILVIAAMVGILKAIGKAQVLLSLGIILVAAVIYGIAEPEALKNLGTGILNYLTLHPGAVGSGVEPTTTPAPAQGAN